MSSRRTAAGFSKQVVGDTERYPRKSDAKKAVENFRAEINAQASQLGRMTVDEAWGHFQAHELYDPEINRSPTTVETGECLLTSSLLFVTHF